MMRALMGISALVAAVGLAACVSHHGPAPAVAAHAPQPPVAVSEAPAAGGSVAAPGISAEPAPPPPPPGDVVVPGPARPINPNGDPRTVSERMSDIRAWDQCVTRAQAVGDSDPNRVQMDSPEELCSRSLGMASRTAVPESRVQRQR